MKSRKKVGCFLINVDLAIFQPYLDLEAGDNQSLKIQVARRGIEPRSSCSASQELNHSATAAPKSRKKTRQVRENWSQRLEHKQVRKRDGTRCPENQTNILDTTQIK